MITSLLPIFSRFALVLTLVATSAVAHADDNFAAHLQITFAGRSTLHAFDGTAEPIAATVTPEPEAPKLWRADIEIPVDTLNTGNEGRDKKMRAMFDADNFPVIRGTLRNVDPEQVRKRQQFSLLLTIRDVEKEVIVEVAAWQADADEVGFDASFDVSLEQFDLKAPGFLFVRVNDTVTVTAHVTVTSDRP